MSDLDALFFDLADTVTIGSKSIKGIFDMPDELVGGGVVISRDYQLLVKSSDISALSDGDTLTVRSQIYEVRQIRQIDDGQLSRIMLSKT